MKGLAKRERIVKDETPSTHPHYAGMRKRTFGFHKPQRPRIAKVQHPKPQRES